VQAFKNIQKYSPEFQKMGHDFHKMGHDPCFNNRQLNGGGGSINTPFRGSFSA